MIRTEPNVQQSGTYFLKIFFIIYRNTYFISEIFIPIMSWIIILVSYYFDYRILSIISISYHND